MLADSCMLTVFSHCRHLFSAAVDIMKLLVALVATLFGVASCARIQLPFTIYPSTRSQLLQAGDWAGLEVFHADQRQVSVLDAPSNSYNITENGGIAGTNCSHTTQTPSN